MILHNANSVVSIIPSIKGMRKGSFGHLYFIILACHCLKRFIRKGIVIKTVGSIHSPKVLKNLV